MKMKWVIAVLIFLVGVLGTSTVFMGWRLKQIRDTVGPHPQERSMMRDRSSPRADQLSSQTRRRLHETMMKFRSRTGPLHKELQNQQQALYQAWKSDDNQRVDSILQTISEQRLTIAREAFGMLDSASVFLTPQQQEMVLQRILNVTGGPPPRAPRTMPGAKFRNR
ncbi:MAG: hypothetical protein ACQETE_03260 [Bacteroidota bacterium]